MSPARAALAAALILAGASGSAARDPFEAMPRSISRSGQFVVYCEETRMRVEVGTFVEIAKEAALAALGAEDRWAHPIVVTLAPRPTARPDLPACALRLLDLEGGLKIEIDVALDGDLAEARFPQKVVEAVLTEIAYRKGGGGGATYRRPPDWLASGIAAGLPGRDGAREAAEVSRGLVRAGRIPPLADFLAMRPEGLDTASAKLFDACSLALVRLLGDLPGGRKALERFVRGLPDRPDGGAEELAGYFAPLAESGVVREKWWALGVARLSASERYRGLTLAETLDKLDAAMAWDLPAPDGAEPAARHLREEFSRGKDPAARAVLERISGQLLALQAEAHPLLRPLVLEWQAIAASLAEGKRRGIRRRIERADADRDAIARRCDEIADYLNWYQATHPTEKSGAFDGYLKAAREGAARRATTQGHDPIARYLDGMERAMREAGQL